MTTLRRLHITLVEMLIVITILALVSGVVGINIARALKSQRFRTEVDLMVDTLRLAQDLMLIMGTDVHVRVKASDDNTGIEYWLDVEGGVPKQWEATVQRSRRLLKEVHGVFFKELQEFPIIEGQLDIRFHSGGSMMSRGVLRLSTHEEEDAAGATVRAICLRGHPHPIISEVEDPDNPITCEDKDETQLRDRLTFYTTQEILEDVPQTSGTEVR